MLVCLSKPEWFFAEVPKTGTTAICDALRYSDKYKSAYCWAKHWPALPPDWFLKRNPKAFISVRNPYSRAVSCWMWCFASHKPETSMPAKLGFEPWLAVAKENLKRSGFMWPMDVAVTVCQPQSLWLSLYPWDFVLKQESLYTDFKSALDSFGFPNLPVRRVNDAASVNPKAKKAGLTSKHWKEHYTGDCKQLVEELWQEDFEALKPYYPEFEKP
jgi:hypothetical protein